MGKGFLAFLIGVAVLTTVPYKTYAQALHIDSNGYSLKQFYRGLGVTEKWQKGHAIDWKTGISTSNRQVNERTYCTRFVASACMQLGIFTLYPLKPSSKFGANTLFDWLETRQARKSGWLLVEGSDLLDIYCRAQQYANSGTVVLVIHKNLTHRPGHSALVMPAVVTCEEIKAVGPVLIQAGGYNSDSTRLIQGFRKRIRTWPEEEILLYYNKTKPNTLWTN